jgi:transposase
MPGKRIFIKLSHDEQHVLETYVSQGQKNARAINRARILRLSHDGMKGKEIAKGLGVSHTTIAHIRKKFHQQEHQDIVNFLQDEPRSGRPIKLDSKVAAHTTMIACSKPPEGSVRWTLHLMADKLIQLNVVNTISHESVRSILKKSTQTVAK